MLLFLLIGVFTSCQENNTNKANPHANIDSTVSEKHHADSDTVVPLITFKLSNDSIAGFFNQYPKLTPLKNQIDTFYKHRQNDFIWFNNKSLTAQALSLYQHVENISSEGLPDKTIYKNKFSTFIKNEGKRSDNNPSAYAELMFTAQYFMYANIVWAGLDHQESKNLKWHLPRNKISYLELLDSIKSGKNLFDSPPLYRQYVLLKNYLKKYQEEYSKINFPVIKGSKKIYKKGDSSSVITNIRQCLFTAGDLKENNNSNLFDDTLEAAVRNFQQRFGQKVDGIIGKAFIKEINVPVDVRIQQIIVNMERSRWVPVNTLQDYLVINIPEYKMHVYENNDLIWSMDVVVGKPAHATVIFNGDIKYIVFSPYWNVPASILQKEVLPGIRTNKNYLSEHQMEWNGNKVRQKPGIDNSLGLVKFLFPNSYSIYLHDTPAKSLFGESTRAFSHGCIRLQDARKLAVYLLHDDVRWDTVNIDKAMHSGKEQYVTLKKPMPVFIVYFTAWVDRLGRLNFRDDAYKRDKPLAALILNRPAF